MKTSMARLAAVFGLVAGLVTLGLVSLPPSALAEEHALPGMCNGRTDANIEITAHANSNRRLGVPNYTLEISTDEVGTPSGTLAVGRGPDRLRVEEWCRLWQHQPGDTPQGGDHCEGDEHEIDEGAITAHAVGLGWHRGQQVLVRTDIRSNDEGMLFRVRYRALGQHHEEVAAAEEDEGCEDESWTRLPAEGWAPLARLDVTVAE